MALYSTLHTPLRYLLFGCVNTAGTYLLYIILLSFMPYGYSYLVAYVVGIYFSYYLQSKYVFLKKRHIKSFVFYPLLYVFQYLISAGLIYVFIKYFGAGSYAAPAAAIAITAPLMYFFTKIYFKKLALYEKPV